MHDALATTFDWSKDGSVSLAIVRAIAEFEGLDATEVESIHRAIDTDALDALFLSSEESDDAPGPVVTFRFRGYRVRVSWTGQGKLFLEEGRERGTSEEAA